MVTILLNKVRFFELIVFLGSEPSKIANLVFFTSIYGKFKDFPLKLHRLIIINGLVSTAFGPF